MQIELLEEIGLTKSEIKTYYALLELGSTTTGKIVDKAGVASSKIYEILDKLMDKGLANFIIKGSTKYFEAASPKRIIDYIDERQAEIARQKNELKKLLPELELKRQLSKYKSEAKIYKGYKGIETAFYEALDLLNKGDEMLVTGIPSRSKYLNRFFVKFGSKRANKNILMRAIFNEEARGEAQTEHEKVKLMKIKYIPQITPAAINIFKNRVLIFPETKDEPILVAIDNKEVAESFRVQFEMMWSQDTTVTKGFEELKKILINFIDTIPKGETYNVLGAGYGEKEMTDKYVEVFREVHKYRTAKGVQAKMLFQNKTEENIKKVPSLQKYTDIKFLPYNQESPAEIMVSKDKTILLIQEGKEPTIITIDNPAISGAFLKNFELVWNQNVSTITGFEDVTKKFDNMLEQLEEGEEYYVLGASLELGSEKLQEWTHNFHKKRIKDKKKVKFLTSYEAYEPIRDQVVNSGDPQLKFTEMKKLSPEFSSPFQINLWKQDTVWITMWEGDMKCFEIKSKQVYDNFKTYFDALWEQKIRVYQGREGVKKVVKEMLDFGDYDSIAEGMKIVQVLGRDYFKWWQSEKKKRKIKSRVIMGTKYKDQPTVTDAFAEFKFITGYENPGATLIFKDKVVSMVLEDEPAAFIISDKTLADANRVYFNMLWNQEVTVSKGLNIVQELFEEMLNAGHCDFIGARGYFMDYRQEYMKDWEKRAEKSGFTMRNITDPGVKGHTITKFSFAKTKYTLEKEFAELSVFWIFGGKVAISNWAGKEPIVTIIENKQIFDLYKKQFESLWKK
ncbi:MAG: hypothetical protein KKA51_05210 [Nanoarchaeota archaeon]|nr:hypothetical protein [Nanoarchaeota archaeon]MBU1269845.1 hypothetical protein [Nanoarchaeota archaeon]MBU2442968.1 hypothetical protein [Nanoarchaeota archaeon]